MKLDHSRLRWSPWTCEESINDEKILLKLPPQKGSREVELNLTSKLLWQLCDGSRDTNQVVALFCDAYPNNPDVKSNVLEVLQDLLEQEFLVIDGGTSALEYRGNVVRKLLPSVELLWQLETIRQFLFSVLRVQETARLDSDLETLLNDDALRNAMASDIDAADQMNDSRVISYEGTTHSPSFVACCTIIAAELKKICPEIESEISLSGNAVYLRGAHMGWHSNHSRSDGRIYCSWAEHADCNFFRYQHPLSGEIITDWEDPGWNIKSFTIPPKPARFWHCIGANSIRLSLGFRYKLPQPGNTLVTPAE